MKPKKDRYRIFYINGVTTFAPVIGGHAYEGLSRYSDGSFVIAKGMGISFDEFIETSKRTKANYKNLIHAKNPVNKFL